MEEYNHGYFQEALSNFTKDFAYGGAIRHLVNHGYTVDRIIKEFNYPLSRETIEKMVNRYLEEKKRHEKIGCNEIFSCLFASNRCKAMTKDALSLFCRTNGYCSDRT